jgi:RimJ/RimL family protein N-acetyltransferase
MSEARRVSSSGGPTERRCVLETTRTRLTTWLPDDLHELRALHSDPRAMRYMRSGVEDPARTSARLAAFLREQAERGWTKWRVEDRSGRMLGRAGFNLSADGRRRELGYVLAPVAWGRGLGTELAVALVRWHRRHLDGLDPALQAWAFPENVGSRRVLEKCGFVPDEDRDAYGMTRYLLVADRG